MILAIGRSKACFAYALALGTLLMPGAQPAWAAPAEPLSVAQYRSILETNAGLARQCAHDASACVAERTGDDLRLRQPGTTVRLDWLRNTLTKAHTATPLERERLMNLASARLTQELGELGVAATTQGKPPVDARPRTIANAILAGREFRSVDAGPTWWQLLLAKFWRWVNRVLFNAVSASARRPWIGILLEWSLLAAALGGVLVYAWRALRRDRVDAPIAWANRSNALEKAGTDWDDLVESAVAAAMWREAIHALYWAAVERLTVAGRWRRAAPRTPREYLRLLEPASATRTTLAALTRLLELAWYARRPMSEQDYRQARLLATELGVPQPAGHGTGRGNGVPR